MLPGGRSSPDALAAEGSGGPEERLMPDTVLSAFVVDPQRIGGVEMFCRELSVQLNARGWKSVLCFSAAPPEHVRSFLDGPGVTIDWQPGIGGLGRGAIRGMSGLLRKHRPAILHMHFTPQVGPYPWLARLRGVRRNYLTDHISRPEGAEPKRAAWWKIPIARVVNWPLTGLIAVSDYNARATGAYGMVPQNRVTRIYNGVDLSRIAGDAATFRRQYQIPERRAIVLQVSWMIPEKGVEDVIHAARLVLAANPNVQFVLAGEGVWRQQYMARAEAAGLADHFTWTGLLADPLTSGAYRAADVVCQLSRWEEAFGWMIAEAMACSRPLVATRAGGIPEIVEDGASGYLVRRRLPTEAADRILRLLADPELRETMGAHGRRAVESRFNLETNVARLLELYGIDGI
jgi:glycosyltransferase involved in cell wall biosynthesis